MAYTFLIIVILAVLIVLGIAVITDFQIDDFHYDRLKWIVERGHFIVVFVGVLVKTFDFPYGTETVTVIAALFAMLAGFCGISARNYYAENSTHEMTDEEADEWLDEDEELCDELDKYEEGGDD